MSQLTRQVNVEGEAAVLAQDVDAADARIQAVGQGKIDDAVHAPEDNGGLGLVPGQGRQALALAPGHDDGGEAL